MFWMKETYPPLQGSLALPTENPTHVLWKKSRDTLVAIKYEYLTAGVK